MKKLLSILLAFTLVFGLAACGSGSNSSASSDNDRAADDIDLDALEPEAGASLIVWESGGSEKDFVEYVAKEFEARYGVPVTFEEVGHTDAPTKMAQDGPAGLGADVFAAPHDHLGAMVSAGLILENFFPEAYADDFMDAAVLGTSYDGALYGYPLGIETYGLFYNKDLVTKLPETWDELIKMSADFTDVRQNKYGIMAEVANFYFMYAFIGGYGGYVFGDNNTDPSELGLNNEGAVQAGHFIQRLKRETLPLRSEDISYDIKGSLFEEGSLMFDLNGPWAVAGYRDAGVNFGVMPFPKLDNGQVPTSFSGIRAFYVNSNSQYPIAATLFAAFATSEEMLVKRFEITGQLPPHLALLDNPTIKNDEIAAAFLQQAEYAVPMPNIPQMPSVWDPMGTALALIWNDEADPKETLDRAVQQIRESMPR